MNTFDLYGISVSSLTDAKECVGQALGLNLIAHESSHHCGDYWRIDLPEGASLILQQNYDRFDDEWTEAEFQDWPFLLYISKHPCADELQEKLREPVSLFAHLRRRILP
jgi:hypothetical protein